jgi:hypothetical protein
MCAAQRGPQQQQQHVPALTRDLKALIGKRQLLLLLAMHACEQSYKSMDWRVAVSGLQQPTLQNWRSLRV